MRCLKCGQLPCRCVKTRKLRILDMVKHDSGAIGSIQGFHERGRFARVKLAETSDVAYLLTEELALYIPPAKR